MNTKGKTTRLILEALTHLSSGFDVVIIAHPASEAFEIADRVFDLAKNVLSIPCELSEGGVVERTGDVPTIAIRPFDWTPHWIPSGIKPLVKVLYDHSARFERAGEWAMVGRERAVVTRC